MASLDEIRAKKRKLDELLRKAEGVLHRASKRRRERRPSRAVRIVDNDIADASSLAECFKAFRPRERMRYLDWARMYAVTNEGRPYDHRAYPHIGAPGGPADAFDDPSVREIWLQWASRLGKTYFGQCALLKQAATEPCPMMFAGSAQKVALEVVERTYAMAHQSPALNALLPPIHKQRKDNIDLGACEIFVAWARSKDTLADKNIKVGHANELDKWERTSTSTEGDPLKLFTDRGKSFAATRKYIFESTPAVKHRSRVEDGLLRSTNCRFNVPCPECGRYQALRMGRAYRDMRKLPDDNRRGGLEFDRNGAGRWDTQHARDTARYVCEHCDAEIGDHHRAWMMRRGVWCPHGCTVNDEGAAEQIDQHDGERFISWARARWIDGTPTRDGHAAGYQLSSLYALTLAWGDVAGEAVDSFEKPANLQNYVNQWMGETWELVSRGQTWEQLGERLMESVEIAAGVVPAGHSVLVAGIDRQHDRFVWTVKSFGPDNIGHVVAYGEADDETQLYERVIDYTFSCADGGGMQIHFALIDSGYRAKDVYEWCKACAKKGKRVYPCKGSATSLGTLFKISELGKDTSSPGTKLVNIDTINTQEWLDKQLHDKRAGEPGSMTLYKADLQMHQDFLEQLLNDAAVMDLDTNNYEREKWQRPDISIPNDYRDTLRYANVAMLLATRGKPILARQSNAAPTKKPEPSQQPKPRLPIGPRPGGWLNRAPPRF